MHLIEHGFQLTALKSNIVRKLIGELPSQSFVLVIDAVSCWREFTTSFSHEEKSLAYLNSASLLHFDSFVSFLAQLSDSPREALSRCKIGAPLHYQLGGIVIDNISYYTHDGASYDLLFKLLRTLRSRYGCIILTVGYGLEFYNGVELASSSSQSYEIPTRLPMSYAVSYTHLDVYKRQPQSIFMTNPAFG